MSKTYMTVKLGGIERGLNFKMGALRYLGELTGKDPLLKEDSGANGFEVEFNTLKNIVHAGLLCNCDAKDKEPDFSDSDVIKWVGQLEPEESRGIVNFFSSAYKVAGEGNADTQ
jgi:hypothetical protein